MQLRLAVVLGIALTIGGATIAPALTVENSLVARIRDRRPRSTRHTMNADDAWASDRDARCPPDRSALICRESRASFVRRP
jgi:hypothetical protein